MFLPTINAEFRTSAIIDPQNDRIPERVAGFSERMLGLVLGCLTVGTARKVAV